MISATLFGLGAIYLALTAILALPVKDPRPGQPQWDTGCAILAAYTAFLHLFAGVILL